MINVPIDRIVPLTDARDNFSKIVAELENQHDGMYVLTKGGKPAIALINVNYLAELMEGKQVNPTMKPSYVTAPKPVIEEKKPEMPHPSFEAPKPPATMPAINDRPTIEKPVSFVPPSPAAAPIPAKPSIDPSWLENKPAPINQPSQTQPVTMPAPVQQSAAAPTQSPAPIGDQNKPKPVNPWPILAPRPVMTPPQTSAPVAPTMPTPPVNTVPTPNPISPPLPQMAPPVEVAPLNEGFTPRVSEPPKMPTPPANNQNTTVSVPINTPKPIVNEPSNFNQPRPIMTPPPVTANPAPQMPTPVQPKPDLPPPPSNPTTIPFDEPPKTSIEPGEEMPPLKSAAPLPNSTNQPINPTPVSMPQPPTQSSIQDIEI